MRMQTETVEQSAQSLSAGWGLGAEPGAALSPVTETERLEYLCDLVGELRSMAEQASFRRLAAILALAHEEARQQLDSR